MARLLLLRHAKSSWDDPVADRDRPLAPRGSRAAPAMARHMVAEGLVPARVLCSPAARTRETWALMAPILGDPPVDFLEPLYGAGPREVIRMVRGHDGPGPLMVIGHNPTVQHVSLMLTGAGSAESRARLGAKFPTAALAVIDFDGSGWDGVAPEAGSLARFIRPKDVDVAAEREL